MGKHSKRNALCWCGSKKKFKKCHGHPSYDKKIELSEIINDHKEIYSNDLCYAPETLHHECSEKIISAHTISKSLNLKSIAEHEHVYSFKPSLGGLIKNGGKFSVEKTSIKKTSTFNGFCSKHDSELFKSIDSNFEISHEHIFLNYYRTLVRELFLKEKNAKFQSDKMKSYDKGMNLLEQIMFQKTVDLVHMGFDVGHRDLQVVKKVLDKKLIDKKFDDMKYYALIINKIPDIMSSGVWVVTSDFNDNELADLSDLEKNYNSLCVSTLLFSTNQGLILFSWNESIDCPECIKFITSLNNLSNDNKIKAAVYWLFTANENIYFSPKWWNNLEISKQKQIIDLFHNTIVDIPKLSLYQDLDIVDWQIEDIKTNIAL